MKERQVVRMERGYGVRGQRLRYILNQKISYFCSKTLLFMRRQKKLRQKL